MIEILRQMNRWWDGATIDTKIPRSVYLEIIKRNLDNKETILLLGSRRVGKTTIMKQWIDYLIHERKIKPGRILYVLLDHPELNEKSIIKIVEEFYKNNAIGDERAYVFLDEIQYKKQWDQEIKALYETKNIKFILSGSAISLISRQKNFLTGRFLKYVVKPLSFAEFRQFNEGSGIDDYLKIGGYPEYVINRDPQYLIDLIDSIVYKDIVEVYNIRHPQIIKDILLILSRAVGFKTSLNKISKTLKISIETVKSYLGFLSEVFLVYEVPKFSRSVNERIYNEKKYYFYDTGIANMLAGIDNFGGLAENTVANLLKNNGLDFAYYYENKNECDFIIKKFDAKGEIVYLPVEVKYDPARKSFEADKNQKGLKGFYDFVNKNRREGGLIITSRTNRRSDSLELVSLEKLLTESEHLLVT